MCFFIIIFKLIIVQFTYRYQLLQGVRSVEIDAYDQFSFFGNGVIVKHLWSINFSYPVSLKNVLKAIKETAFVASDYPVIISIENHVKKEANLQIMEALFHKYLGRENILTKKQLVEMRLSDCRRKYVVSIQF